MQPHQELLRPWKALLRLAGPALLILPAAAQTSLSGSVYDGNGGPLLSGNVYHSNGFSVPSGQTLTIQPGAVLKGNGALVLVDGTLLAAGTAGAPIRITSIYDDSVGGDTNGDGASAGAPGDWQGFWIRAGSTATFEHVVFEYAGGSAQSSLVHLGGTLVATDCSFARSLTAGIDLRLLALPQTITGCDFVDNGTYPIEGARLDALPGMLGNTASGNGTADYVPVREGSTTGDVVIGTDNVIGDVLVLADQVDVPGSLTLERGVIVKWLGSLHPSSRFVGGVGALVTHGTPEEPVVFTSFTDDEHGGDTNGDGASAGLPGDWANLRATTVDLEHTVVRFGGGSPNAAAVSMTSGSLRLANVTIRDSQNQGLWLHSLVLIPDVHDCRFLGNGTYPVDGVSLEQLQGFRNNQAADNGLADAIRSTGTNISTDVVLEPGQYPGEVLILLSNRNVQSGASLTVKAGVILKGGNQSAGLYALAGGELNLRGTAFAPVVLTSLEDDSWGGDTNKDGGATSPSPGDVANFEWRAGSTGSAENALARYATVGFFCDSSDVNLRAIRADHALQSGIRALAHQGPGTNWVAFGCSFGIFLGGNFDLYHATSVDNTFGVYTELGTTGQIVNTIAWNNSSENFRTSGSTHTVTWCCGLDDPVSANHNQNLDPLFVDPAGGDLNLQAGSPCVDLADYATAAFVVKDHDEFSRLLDATQSGNLQADKGAYEHHRWRMDVTGQPHIGSTMILEVTGPAPGSSYYRLSFSDVSQLHSPLGFSMVGLPASQVGLGTSGVNTPLLMRIPNLLALVDLEVRIQTLTYSSASPVRGEWTNLYRACLLPKRPGKPLLLNTPPELGSGGTVQVR